MPGVDSGVPTGGGEGEGEGEPVDCESRTSCLTCTPDYPCGWCPSTNSCMVGTGEGPGTGSCPDWQWIRTECADYVAPDAGPPPPPVDCSMHTSCGDCTPVYPCGWCVNGSGGTCMNGTGEGPDTGTCTGWAWLGSECAMPPPPGP
jgi:hypothetical protein